MSNKSIGLTKEELINKYHIYINGCGVVYKLNRKTHEYEVAPIQTITAKHKYGQDVRYRAISVYDPDTKKPKTLLLHRIVYAWHIKDIKPGMTIDHIDGNTLNNEVWNLRQITLAENQKAKKHNGHNDSVYYSMNGWDNDTVDSYQIFLKCKQETLEVIRHNRHIALAIKKDLEDDLKDIKRQWHEYRNHFKSTYSAKMSYREASTDPEYQRMYQEYKAAKTKYGYAIQQLKDELKTYTKATKHAKEAKFQP